MDNEIHVVFMPANPVSVMQPMDQGVISTFKSCFLRNMFHKVMAAIHLMNLGREFTILDAIKNICDLWKEVKNISLNRHLKEVSSLMGL